MAFVHGESFTGHVLLAAAASAVLDSIDDNQLLPIVRDLANHLERSLHPLADLPLVGEVRGRGLLRGIELVADKRTKQPFARELRVAERVARAALEREVIVLTGNAAADGINGDTVVVAPPYVTTHLEIDIIADVLRAALEDVAAQLGGEGLWW
jgi:adenosylmethionine-8-amino-7-oxononanoate aminotransferase